VKASIIVCLLSGGIDSTVAAMQACRTGGASIYFLTIFYGQGAEQAERVHAPRVADWMMERYPNAREHFIMEIGGRARVSKDADAIAGSSWSEGFVGWRSPRKGWEKAGYPSTRDEVFTLIAAAGAEARLRDNPDAKSAEVIIATNADDLRNFPDLEASNFTAHLQHILDGKVMPQEGRPVTVSMPLINLTKAEVVALGKKLGAPLELTWSCYFGEPDKPCGECDQCKWRAAAFEDAGAVDV
jgi:7-cyano-7-deazaguanine synthase